MIAPFQSSDTSFHKNTKSLSQNRFVIQSEAKNLSGERTGNTGNIYILARSFAALRMTFWIGSKCFFERILQSVFVFFILAQTFSCFAAEQVSSADLEKGFGNPPVESRIRAYWWWLNGNVTPESISRDLQEMKKMGWGGALVCDADGSNQRGNRQVPAGPLYASPDWRKLMVHALQEADKQGLELSIGIQSGWNVGGPTVQPETAAKHVVWSETQVDGGAQVSIKLPQPKHDERFYRDIAVVGYKVDGSQQSQTENITYKLVASSSQSEHPTTMALDDKPETFWVSGGSQPGEGPTPKNPCGWSSNFPSQ